MSTPHRVKVSLPEGNPRCHQVLVGAGLFTSIASILSKLFRAPLRRGHRRPRGGAVRRPPVAHAARRGVPDGRLRLHLRRGAEEPRDVGAGERRPTSRRRWPARHSPPGIRRRGAGRPGRLRGGAVMRGLPMSRSRPPCWRSRRFGGRQDGNEYARGKEPGGRLPSAALRPDRPRPAADASRGAPARRHGRGREARRHRGCRVPAVDRRERRGAAGGGDLRPERG